MVFLVMGKYKFLILSLIVIVLAAFAVILYVLFLNSSKVYEYAGKKYKVGQSFPSDDGCNTCSFDKNGQMACTLMACNDSSTPPETTAVDMQFKYEGDVYKYSGTVEKPTPCHKIQTDIVIKESYPEQVDIKITTTASDQICVQVISEEEISGEIKVSEDAVIDIYLNGELIKANANR